ncbi:malate synthase A [Frankia sp. AgPm24]|uniref:malate synthase A n=1 Tax=Frankia sp. AgPm24 TaxID=631128 RepID=UPI0020107D7E|nr:malate synthase A [Frankia sp. AgPm24]MCK9920396.1 malate synthase A [Frankia sp. AgPm24]
MGGLTGVTTRGVSVVRDVPGLTPAQVDAVLSEDALAFVAGLHRTFGARRDELLAARAVRRAAIAAGGSLDFLPDTAHIRDGDWQVAPPAPGLVDRRAEITGPTDAKMLINALNSGAKVFMADFEDANVPTWSNMVVGQHNLSEAIAGTLGFVNPDGRRYTLNETTATLVPRPRGWHLPERHVLVDGQPIVAALFDAGLYLFRNALALRAAGRGPYFYLPKMESHLEARLWNDVFTAAQAELGLPVGTVRATVLIETLPAAFEMAEILYELREHSAGLNAGRWDYMFSTIKTFASRPAEFLLPDRNSVTMTVPFLRAYSELLVATCHRHGAHAIGGMAAFIPSRRDPEVNTVALAKVRADKERESGDGFDGSWVAHPDLVPVCTEVFDGVLGAAPNQLGRQRDDVHVTAADLLAVRDTPGAITAAGLRGNISVGVRYLESWLRGTGAVGIDNLMEDAATAEISRSQIFQWIAAGVTLDDGRSVTAELVRATLTEVLDEIRATVGEQIYDGGRWKDAAAVFEETALGERFVEFLTLPAYERID